MQRAHDMAADRQGWSRTIQVRLDADDGEVLDSLRADLGLEAEERILRSVRLAGMMRAVYKINGVVRPAGDAGGEPADPPQRPMGPPPRQR